MLKKYHNELRTIDEEDHNEFNNIHEEIKKGREPLEVFSESPLSKKMKLTDIFYSLIKYVENRD